MIRTYLKFAGLIAVIASLLYAGPTSRAAHERTHQRRGEQTAANHVRRRVAKMRKRIRKQPVSYVCPMHPDMRSRSRGECAKCGMELVSERRSRDRAVVLFH